MAWAGMTLMEGFEGVEYLSLLYLSADYQN